MRMLILIGLVVIAFLGLTNVTVADDAICNPQIVHAQGNNMVLPDAHKIYFIQNRSKQDFWLNHPVTKIGASAGWATLLHAGHWSALLVDKKDFAISCTQLGDDKVEYKNCRQIISICSEDTKREGSFWVVEDATWPTLLERLKLRGM